MARTERDAAIGDNQQLAAVAEPRRFDVQILFTEILTPAPKAVLDGLYRYSAEQRAIDYIVLTTAAAGEIAAPAAEVLQKYFDDRKSGYRAPEYRKLVTLAATPTSPYV